MSKNWLLGLTWPDKMLNFWLFGDTADDRFPQTEEFAKASAMDDQNQLSRRERQIMNVVYARSQASATQVWQDLPDPPSRTAVRTLLRILEEKGSLRHEKRGREFIYEPTRPRQRAGQSALRGVLHTFFDGSLEKAVAAHLAHPDANPSPEELKRLVGLIDEAREKEG